MKYLFKLIKIILQAFFALSAFLTILLTVVVSYDAWTRKAMKGKILDEEEETANEEETDEAGGDGKERTD